ncbi:hypothetical protein [Agromyces sp. M3QZ16-3]|uniref:hypothetical protein n=1 Tax=Agromyces sp. M3QZ16-3 TaxID=3447585 RepID=UPI003F68FADB
MIDERRGAAPSRWISVVFLQDEDAGELLALIDREGEAAAIEYLKQWDVGDETMDAALVNGYVYDRIPEGSADRTVEDPDSPYALTYSELYGYVSLLRRYEASVDAEPVAAGASVETSAPFRDTVPHHWDADPALSAHRSRHAIAL